MILIQNIYYMLSYAFKSLKDNDYKNIGYEEFDNSAELLSEILTRAINRELKRGILKGYKEESDTLSTIRGKINLSETINHNSLINNKIVCDFDVFTEDMDMNRIVKCTLVSLLSSSISKERKKKIKGLLPYFNNVMNIDKYTINWNIRFTKNNQNYKLIINICNFIIHGLIQSYKNGDKKMLDFLDEQRLCALYQNFIYEYYKQEHPELKVNASLINWQLDDEIDLFLPEMRSDILLSEGNRILIIDAKYYKNNMQTYFDNKSIISGNLYQIFTYVKNKAFEDTTKKVSGMLLYAKTEDEVQPDVDYKMSGNLISVKTLDLNSNFQNIKDKLENLLASFRTNPSLKND